mgnify:CR=1 FL=1
MLLDFHSEIYSWIRGGLFVLFLYHLIIYFQNKNQLYLYYSLYLFTITLYLLQPLLDNLNTNYLLYANFSVQFLATYSVSVDVINRIDLSSYISTITSVTLASGVVFELPIVVYFLSRVGILTPEIMRTYRKHSIVVILVLAAIITPPDIISQIIVAIPILILYELSIYISKVVIKRELKKSKQNA